MLLERRCVKCDQPIPEKRVLRGSCFLLFRMSPPGQNRASDLFTLPAWQLADEQIVIFRKRHTNVPDISYLGALVGTRGHRALRNPTRSE